MQFQNIKDEINQQTQQTDIRPFLNENIANEDVGDVAIFKSNQGRRFYRKMDPR